MVRVFHWNHRLFQYNFICTSVVLLFIFVNFFEVIYHSLYNCKNEEAIDVVYTWVNGSDPRFLQQLNFYLEKYKLRGGDSSPQRYDDKNELKYSLRSLEKYAPWVRHVYIVTNGQIPQWLNLDYEKLTVITHKEIFKDEYNIPTFSSPAIESQLHRIPGLSNRFIYFNDDVFLQSPIYRDDFISPNRGFLIYLAWLLPMCALDCSWLYVADGHCDQICNNPKCQNDGGDCDNKSKTLLGDVIVKLDDYDFNQETNYEKILSKLQNISTARNFPINNQITSNITSLIDQHNRKILILDKINRRKIRKTHLTSVDAYAESLQHTNRILNDKYGFSVRKVPSHAPIMVDRAIMEAIHTKFQKYLEKTARNRVRSVDDVQFAFLYYYFLIHEKIELSIDQIFDEFDTDSSRVWCDNEIRTVVAKLYELPITDEALIHFTDFLVNCSSRSQLPTLIVTKDFIRDCKPLANYLKLSLGSRHKFQFEILKDAEKKYVSFQMLNSNITQVITQLDEVRKSNKKFVCLNDNLDRFRASDNQIIKKLMLDFYQSLFPVPSKFELPENYRNKFLYIEDYKVLRNQQEKRLVWIYSLITLTIVIILINSCRRKICEFIL